MREKRGEKLMASPLTLINCGQCNTERSEKQNIGVTKTAYALFLVLSQVGFQTQNIKSNLPRVFQF